MMRAVMELIREADENQVEAWRRMLITSAATREATFGSVRAIVTGSPVDLFNPVFALGPTEEVEADLGAALRFVERAGVPPMVYLHDDDNPRVEALLSDRGLCAPDRPMPGMVLDPILPWPDEPTPLEVRPASTHRELEELTETVARGFGMPVEVVRRVFTPSILGSDGLLALCGYLDGRPVGTSMLVATGGVAGVYTVAVVPEARRRGFGRLLTIRAIEEGVARGATRACLQASAMGEPVYLAMGFRTVTAYRLFAPGPAL